MVPSVRLFSAEDLIKHFTYRTTTEDGRAWNVDVTGAITHPRVWVADTFRNDSTIVIHVIESDPPPTTEMEQVMRRSPIRIRAYLQQGMYVLVRPPWRTNPKYVFAGKPSAVVWSWHELDAKPTWRIEFGRGRGRPVGKDHPALADMERAMRDLKQNTPQPTKQEFLQKLGRSRDDPRRILEWLEPYGMNYVEFRDSVSP